MSTLRVQHVPGSGKPRFQILRVREKAQVPCPRLFAWACVSLPGRARPGSASLVDKPPAAPRVPSRATPARS